MGNNKLLNTFVFFLTGALALIAGSTPAWATGLSLISANLIDSMGNYPGLVSTFAYLAGTAFAVLGVFKVREHVDNPGQTPLKDSAARFGASGVLLSLPYLYDVVTNTVYGGPASFLDTLALLANGLLNPLQSLTTSGTGFGFQSVFVNFVSSLTNFPGLASAASYAIGITLAVWGVIKLKMHVDEPRQVPLKDGIVRLLAAGVLLSFPQLLRMVSENVSGAFGTGSFGIIASFLGMSPDVTQFESTGTGTAGGFSATGDGVNAIANNLILSFRNVPGLVTILAYLTGIVLAIKAVLDFVSYVNNGPNTTPLRTPIITMLIAGAMMSLPFVFRALVDSVTGAGGWNVSGLNMYNGGGGTIMFMAGGQSLGFTDPGAACDASTAGLTAIFCQLWFSTQSIPGVLAGFSYIAGLVMGYFGLVKLKDAVNSPQQTQISEAGSRLAVSALLLVLPYVANVFYESLVGDNALSGFNVSGGSDGVEANVTAGPAGRTLDVVTSDFVFSIYQAMGFIFTAFGYIAGLALIIMGVFRMMKTMQDGPRGPGGVGTIFTFLTGAALLALSPMMGALSATLFGDPAAESTIDFSLSGGTATVDYENQIRNFMSAVMAYMLIVGWVSFIRGLFLMRGVAEGDQQASMMSAVTHIIAGAVLVNLGPFLEALQNTLGVGGIASIGFT